MIEAVKNKKELLGYYLAVDGAQIHISALLRDGERISPRLSPGKLTQRVLDHRFSEIPGLLRGFEIDQNIEIDKDISVFRVDVERIENDNEWLVKFGFAFDAENWSLPFSISSYATEFESILGEMADRNLYSSLSETQHPDEDDPNEEGSNEFEYMMRVTNIMGGNKVGLVMRTAPELRMSSAVEELTHRAQQINQVVKNSLLSAVRSNSVAMYFEFPEEVRVPCEQYLIYFVQFLRDLGVEANAELKHEADQLLFFVTPNDPKQGLHKIRAALDLYLQLPSSPIGDDSYESVQIQRLEANILRFRSDLKLAAAELQTQRATIQAQRLAIEMQRALLSGEIILNSLKERTPRQQTKAEEELLWGTVSLIPVEGKGLRINLPEIFRKLKRLFDE